MQLTNGGGTVEGQIGDDKYNDGPLYPKKGLQLTNGGWKGIFGPDGVQVDSGPQKKAVTPV